MNKPYIKISNLTKRYIINVPHNINPIKNVSFKKTDVIALDNVSFDVYKDETIGIIGSNGAGKTTLLKIINEITKPTSGTVELFGTAASFFDIGFSFHSDLTGLDNIYFISSLYGIRKKELQSRIAELIDFSEIGQRINTQVKYYSRGMKVKLAFSIILYLDADIMLFDEISFLGEDYKFRNKINEKIRELNAKKTILFVSHYLEDIKDISSRILWLEDGKIKMLDKPDLVYNEYIRFNS